MKHESRIHKTIVCVFDMMSAFLMQCILSQTRIKQIIFDVFIMFIHNMQCTFKYLYAGERLFMPAGASEILEIL